MNRRARRVLWVPAILVSVCAGCGSGFNYGQVKGTVTLDRVPLVGAKVYFYPILNGDGPVPPSSLGITDAAGNYELVARNDVAGAVLGPHKVVVLFPSTGAADAAKRPKIPLDYTLMAKTPLSFDVKPGLNEYPIALKSK
jgi:hypothetical protein